MSILYQKSNRKAINNCFSLQTVTNTTKIDLLPLIISKSSVLKEKRNCERFNYTVSTATSISVVNAIAF